MIRINLLAVDRGGAKRRRASSSFLIPAAHRVTAAASLIVLGTMLGLGWWYWSLQRASSVLDSEIATAERETQALRSVLSEVQKFETRKAQLQQRVTLIEQLRQGQGGPVRALDEVSKAIPERLWLTEMKQEGDVYVISGMTTSLTGLSDFVAALEASRWFRAPIDIIDSQADASAKTADIYKFSIRATFENPDAPKQAQPAAGRGRGARGRGGRGAAR